MTCGYNHDSTPSIHCFEDWGEFETEEQTIEAWNTRATEWYITSFKATEDVGNAAENILQPAT